MKFLFYLSMVCFMAALPAVVIGQLVSVFSDDVGLFVGLFVFVSLVCESFYQHMSAK
jgi:hypothetical protein